MAEAAVAALKDGDVLLLENTRFHAGEETNDPAFASALAALGDIFVNDAFSAAHRAHASTEGMAQLLPVGGRPRDGSRTCAICDKALDHPEAPADGGGGRREGLDQDRAAGKSGEQGREAGDRRRHGQHVPRRQGFDVGKSLYEPDHLDTARKVIHMATESGCAILLPADVVVAKEFKRQRGPPHRCRADEIADDEMAWMWARKTIAAFEKRLAATKTLVWNGPFGAFETPPFDAGTVAAAQAVAEAHQGRQAVVAWRAAAIRSRRWPMPGVEDDFTYVSTAGGAFLEWLEGQGIAGRGGAQAVTEGV